jgi:parallel beta-helix repeat protein
MVSGMRRRRRLSVAATCITALAATALSVGQASAAPVQITSCAAIVSNDAILANDLSCPGQNGIQAAGLGITIDLAGHTLTGNGTNTGIGIFSDSVTIKNGTVKGFSTGLKVGADNAQLLSVRVSGAAGSGIQFDSGRGHALISASRIVGNGANGIFVSGGDGVQVTGSKTSANGDSGIALINSGADACDDDLISSNTITANGLSGIEFFNSATHHARPRILNNKISGNATAGILLATADDGKVKGNTVTGNHDVGISLVTALNTKVISNTVTYNGNSGLIVGATANNATVRSNVADGNIDDGIHNGSASALIDDNTARFNTDLGISSPVPTTPGTGNVAKDNGNPAQCTWGTCTS